MIKFNITGKKYLKLNNNKIKNILLERLIRFKK